MTPIDDASGTATEQPADDIRSVLNSAVAEHDAGAEAPVKPEGKSSVAPEGEVSDGARKRGADGKFLKAADDAGPVETDKTGDVTAKPEGESDSLAPEKTEAEKAEALKSEDIKAELALTGKWSAKDKETFKALPPEGRDLLLRRHKEMEGLVTKKTQEIAAFRKEYEPVHKLLEPWGERMKASGYTPSSLITSWANVERRLMDGDGVGVVAGLIKGYKIDMGKVAQALGLRPQRAAAGADGEQPPAAHQDGAALAQLPPEITDQLRTLQDRLDAQDREKAETTRRTQMGAEQRVMSDIENFKSAQDDKGQLLHPHFDELEDDMTSLAQAAMAARKPVPSLQELYDKAVWANPSTREARLAADQKAQRDKVAQEARAKAERAKRAGSSVTGAPGSGQAPSAKVRPEQSLREQLEAAAADAAEA